MLFHIDPLRLWVHKVLPVVYDDSLSYYEVLAKVTKKLNEVIDLTEEQNQYIEEFSTNLTNAINNWEDGMEREWSSYKSGLNNEWGAFQRNTEQYIENWKNMAESDIEDAIAAGINQFVSYFSGLTQTAVDAAEEAMRAAETAAQDAVDAVMPTLESEFDERYAWKTAVGSPLVTTTAAGMTDTTKVYVYAGSETGYVNGDWYYYDGTAWQDGGVYNSAAVVTDPTLSESGVPADAKAAGDEIADLKSATTETQIINFDDYQTVNYGISTGNKWNYDSSYRACSVPVTDNVAKITVTANDNLPALFALVQLIDYTDRRAVTYATGEYRRTLNAGETVTIDVPDDCHYLWVLKSNDGGSTIKTPSATSFYLVKKTPLVDETLSISGDAADAKVTGDCIKGIHEKIGITENLEVTSVRPGYINYSSGAATNTSGSTSYTYHVNISAYESLIYSRLYSTSSSSNAGMAFYDEGGTYISGQRCAIKQSSTRYVLTEIAVPEDAVTARFTQNDSLTGFVLIGKLKGYAETSLQGQIDTLNDDLHKLVPPPLKRVSILGDSISTFASPYETFEGSKWAPEGCVTNYPGNRLRYPDGDITEVNQLWWKIVLDYFGWSLGINDSWAGSRISWDGTEDTDSTHTRPSHVGENIYFGSPTRIGHLGENGTPDIIFIFGGTNDINHLATSQIGTLPTDDPSGYDQTALDALAVNTFKDAVTAMVLRIQYAYPAAKIIALLPYYVTDNYSGKTPYTVKVFDDAMIECYDYLGVEHIDLRKTMSIYNIHNVLADDLHPNAAYMRVIADAVIKHIIDTVS